jgi:hypothetical protein
VNDIPVRTVLLRFAATAPLGVLLTIAGELVGPMDVKNAVGIGQYGLIFLTAGAALVVSGLRWPSSRRVLAPALAALTMVTAVAYFMPLAWVLGCAGASLSVGATTRLLRVSGIVCAFVALAWFVAYLVALLADL